MQINFKDLSLDWKGDDLTVKTNGIAFQVPLQPGTRDKVLGILDVASSFIEAFKKDLGETGKGQ